MTTGEGSATKRIPLEKGFLTGPLSKLDDVRLQGTRCCNCGEVFLGPRVACGSCQSREMESVALAKTGTLYTYSIIRYRPPGEYKGPMPFVPFAAGLVELPDGLRVLSRLSDCEFDQLQVGMPLELVAAPFYTDEQGNEVIAYSFKPGS